MEKTPDEPHGPASESAADGASDSSAANVYGDRDIAGWRLYTVQAWYAAHFCNHPPGY